MGDICFWEGKRVMTFKELINLKQKVDQYRPIPPNKMALIEEKFKLEWTYHSNAIEGNTLTLQETAFFIKEGLTSKGKSLKEYLEVQNHAEAIEFVQDIVNENRKITEAFIKELHALLLKGIEDITIGPRHDRTIKKITPGKYKTQPNHVLTLEGTIHDYCDPLKIPEEMEKLVQMIAHSSYQPVELAARVHYGFVAIHPFDDGNGRMARLLMNMILLKNGFPPVVVQQENREEYDVFLQQADKGDLSPFIQFIAGETKQSLLTMLAILES